MNYKLRCIWCQNEGKRILGNHGGMIVQSENKSFPVSSSGITYFMKIVLNQLAAFSFYLVMSMEL